MSESDDILHYGHVILRRKAAPVGKLDDQVADFAARLAACLERAGGLGLSAPQIGCSLRIIAYDIGEGPQVVINPRIARSEGLESSIEGCLSLPGLYGDVARAQSVVVKGRDARGRPLILDAADLLARVLQHEIDHLDGILFVDRVDPGTVHWLVGGSQQDREPQAAHSPQRVYTSVEDALKVFEARLASRRA